MKVLLSIKPEFVREIQLGHKQFEFRRRVFKNPDVDTVVVYATMPVGKVIGEFSIKEIHSGNPREIWHLTSTMSGITREYFEEYFADRDEAYAIEILDFKEFKRPKKLSQFGLKVAPQSFAYVY